MQLKHIDKPTYKKRLNQLQFGGVAALLVLAIGLSEFLNAGWGNPDQANLGLNALAVVIAVFLLAGVFSLYKDHPWMADIRYTWKLKQELNRIYRNSKLVERALDDNDADAFRVHWFHLHGSRHLYQIEDNTLTVPELDEKIAAFEQRLAEQDIEVRVDDYSPDLIERIRQRYA